MYKSKNSRIKNFLSHFKIFTYILIGALSLSVISITHTSCVKEYINGKLEGMWRVDKITLADGSIPYDIKTTSYPVYISFQFHVVQLSGYDGDIFFGNLQYNGETVRLDFPNNTTEDKLRPLNQWGIFSSDVTFTIKSLTKSRLVMSSPESTMECTHF